MIERRRHHPVGLELSLPSVTAPHPDRVSFHVLERRVDRLPMRRHHCVAYRSLRDPEYDADALGCRERQVIARHGPPAAQLRQTLLLHIEQIPESIRSDLPGVTQFRSELTSPAPRRLSAADVVVLHAARHARLPIHA